MRTCAVSRNSDVGVDGRMPWRIDHNDANPSCGRIATHLIAEKNIPQQINHPETPACTEHAWVWMQIIEERKDLAGSYTLIDYLIEEEVFA